MRLLYKTGPMESLRKWFYKPKRDDRSLLAQFFFADDALNMIAAELDSFDGRKDPDRCSTLVNQLRHAQDRVLTITSQIMDQVLGDERVARGFRVKFPEDVLQDNLAGQLWFGAECLAAGSSIMNREEESAAMRPLAKALTRSLETVRSLLREQCLRPRGLALAHHTMLHESLKIFDRLFAEFELCYVSAMVNVKSPHEFEAQQLICVLFSDTLRRALRKNLLTQEQVDTYDPALMFAVPRLAIVTGLLIYSSGPLSLEKPADQMSDMFRPFRTLLHKIRSLLWTLDRKELNILERLLCTNEDISNLTSLDLPQSTAQLSDSVYEYPDIGEFVNKFYADHAHCTDFYTQQSSIEPSMNDDALPDYIEVITPIIDGLERLNQRSVESPTDKPQRLYIDQDDTHQSIDSTDTFQIENTEEDIRVRKISKTDENRTEIASLRNLSTNGLLMFDPLVAITASTSSENRQLPDNDLVTSLNEQVTEITDRLSNIQASNITDQIHSFSTNDVPTLIATDDDNFSLRNDLSCIPSTSHGYLIPNAISQEPVVLSLSHNNSAVFNQDDENNELNGAILNNDLPIIIPDSIDAEIVNTNISITNANLSSLLLTNEEYRSSFDNVNNENIDNDDDSFHSAKTNLDKTDDKVKFMLGYESDHETPVDSGVSTENTSLDRSPDSDQSKEVKSNNFMQQNRVLKSPECEYETKEDNSLENSFSNANGDVTVNIVFIEQSTQKSEAGSSRIENHHSEDEGLNEASANIDLKDRETTSNDENEYRTLGEVLEDMKRLREAENKMKEENNNTSGSSKKSRKSKSKKRTWSPGNVVLDNRSWQAQSNPLRLDLDHFVDENSGPCAEDEQIALALQAQELAARQRARKNFKSSEDLIHRLFVCIAGVADQLQTNFAADLRNILKSVFQMNQTPEIEEIVSEKKDSIEFQATEDQVMQNGSSIDSVYSAEEAYADSNSDGTNSESSRVNVQNNETVPQITQNNVNFANDPVPQITENNGTQITQNNSNNFVNEQSSSRRKSMDNSGGLQSSVSTGDLTYRSGSGAPERLPEWVPDIAAAGCMRCAAAFTAFRRRHHCRNCGKVFCASCSANSVPLPRYGQMKPVRVCEECFQTVADNCRRRR